MMTFGQGREAKLVHAIIPEEGIKITCQYFIQIMLSFFPQTKDNFPVRNRKALPKKKRKITHEKEFIGFGRK